MTDRADAEPHTPEPGDVPPGPPAALEALDVLVGEWSYEGSHAMIPNTVLRGRTAFEWLEGKRFLVQREAVDDFEMPSASISVIGAGGPSAPLVEHYFDSRGVARVYSMSFDKGVWRRWRDHPGFSQRSAGAVSGDGKVITLRSELSRDGVTWEHEMELTYTRLGADGSADGPSP